MCTNLVHNVKEALEGFPVRNVFGWLDSNVALHWIRGEYKQFVSNHVKKIQAKSYIQWRHVRSEENPADVGSRGGQIKQSWQRGPDWLSHPENWPKDIITHPTDDTEAEAKLVKEVLGVAVEEESESDGLMTRHNFWKAIRITVWIAGFLWKCRAKKVDKKGPLTTEETEMQIKFWIKRIQERASKEGTFQEDKARLNL